VHFKLILDIKLDISRLLVHPRVVLTFTGYLIRHYFNNQLMSRIFLGGI